MLSLLPSFFFPNCLPSLPILTPPERIFNNSEAWESGRWAFWHIYFFSWKKKSKKKMYIFLFAFAFDKTKIIRKITPVLSCFFHVCVFLIFPYFFSLLFTEGKGREKKQGTKTKLCFSLGIRFKWKLQHELKKSNSFYFD